MKQLNDSEFFLNNKLIKYKQMKNLIYSGYFGFRKNQQAAVSSMQSCLLLLPTATCSRNLLYNHLKYIIGILLIIFNFNVKSQTVNLEDIMTYLKAGNAVKAKEVSDSSINDKELINNPRTWFYRAITYHSMYESELQDVKALSKQPLFEAYNSYLKTMQLDYEKKYNSEVINSLKIIASQFVNEGIMYFNNGDYNNALSSFENNISINRLPAINKIDTIILYNAALSADKSGKNTTAIDYYEQLIKMEFGGSNVCLDLAKVYKKENKINDYLNTLQNGLKAFPNEDIGFISELVNYYLETGKNEEAMSYVDKGLLREPKNQAFHFVKASLLDQKGDLVYAEKEYLKVLEFDPEYTDAMFNLGALYYNQATDLIKKATSKSEQNKAYELYGKAQPYLEKIILQTPNDIQIMKMLKTIYTLLKQDDKLIEINKKLEKSQE